MAWQILLSRRAPAKLVALLKDLHTNHCGVVRAELDSGDIPIDRGFKQGCVLAPDLFNVYLDTVICQLEPLLRKPGVSISFRVNGDLKQYSKPTDEELLWILLYADDITLITESVEKLETSLDLLDTAFSEWN